MLAISSAIAGGGGLRALLAGFLMSDDRDAAEKTSKGRDIPDG